MFIVCGIWEIIHKLSCHIIYKIRLCFRKCIYYIFHMVSVHAFVEASCLSSFTVVVDYGVVSYLELVPCYGKYQATGGLDCY